MEEKTTKNGKRYLQVTDDEIKQLPPGTCIYDIDVTNHIKGIAPPDCKHEFIITGGIPNNIKGCKKCIYWRFTREPTTEPEPYEEPDRITFDKPLTEIFKENGLQF